MLRFPQLLRSDNSIVNEVQTLLSSHAHGGGRYALLETAGGVLSPSPSGSLQADLYRPLRLPSLLVGDAKLGGIGTTISAFESLHVRGYDTQAVILFNDAKWGNYEYLKDYFRKLDLFTFDLPLPPPRRDSAYDDEQAMEEYYEETAESAAIAEVVDLIHEKHFSRISKLTSMPAHAESIIWHPFRQYGLPQSLVAIDSAYADNFAAFTLPEALEPESKPVSGLDTIQPSTTSLLKPLFDGSASWWTQGLGHGNPTLALTAAHAAGRYGHVMFANAVHEPALDLAYNLLSTLANPRLSRVFYTDNGSTGMEVAVKMALRASCARYNWSKDDGEIGILGLKGSYHGDTIGVMNCSESGVFNEKVDWHHPWGHWFDPPTIKMVQGKWVLDIPDYEGKDGLQQVPDFLYDSLTEIWDFEHGLRKKIAEKYYKDYITTTLKRLVHVEGRRFGALIMEPVLMGAGGMIFVDPLFQRTLIQVIREDPSLISPTTPKLTNPSPNDWTGLPVVADEVFTGLYRLGRASSSSFLNSTATKTPSPSPFSSSTTTIPLDTATAPDISVHAKLLTGGLLPLAITTASESIFNTFLSDRKSDALLHGHSYTAHAVGCAVADKSLKIINKMAAAPATAASLSSSSTSIEEAAAAEGTWEVYRDLWKPPNTTTTTNHPFSFFSPTTLHLLSHSPKVSSVIALGTVLAITLRDTSISTSGSASASGYSSNAAVELQKLLLLPSMKRSKEENTEEAASGGIHCRVLGDVLYVMTSLTTQRKVVEGLEGRLLEVLC